MPQKSDFKTVFANLRFVYITLYMLLIAFVSTIPVRRLVEGRSGVIYGIVALLGCVLLAVDFFTRRVIFKPKYCTLLILFVIACIISSFYNIKYGFMSNVKAIIWGCIQFFLIVGVDTELNINTTKKHFKALTEIFSFCWLIFVAISFYQFVIQYSKTWHFPSQFRAVHEGFFEGRLYGIFSDPNYASLCSVFVIFFCIINFKGSIFNKIYHILNISAQFFYIVLSGSRTSILCFIISLCLFSGICSWNKLEKMGMENLRKISGSLLAVTLCFLVIVMGSYLIKTFSVETAKFYRDSISHNQNGDTATKTDDLDDIEISLDRLDVSQNSDVSNGRITIWTDYLKVFAKSPIFGTSPRNAMSFAKDHFDSLFIIERNYSVHNTYLAILVYTGIFGTAILAVWAVCTLIEIARVIIRRRKTQDEYYFNVVVLTMILTVCAIAAFPSLFIFFDNSTPDIVFWITLGYTKAFIRISEPERYKKETLIFRITQKLIPNFKKHSTENLEIK